MLRFDGPPGTTYNVRVYRQGEGADLLFIHGAGGLLEDDPFLRRLSAHFKVSAPVLPGYEDSQGAEHLNDMLDFTLHVFDVWKELGLVDPIVVGHSMGGMIAAEMASIAPDKISTLALLCPAGLWLDEHPFEEFLSAGPFDLPSLLLHDPHKHGELLSLGTDIGDLDELIDLFYGTARSLDTASKLVFPVPDRGLRNRLYRITAATHVIWGESDRLIPPLYADEFANLIPHAQLHMIEAAGHMVQYEQPEAVLNVLLKNV